MTLRHVTLHKPRGTTPLAAIEEWKKAHPQLATVRACYAGRLDPMAEGKLLVLLGDECRRLKKYTKLDKEYEIEIVFDLASDTGDVLGLPAYAGSATHPTATDIMRSLATVLGTHEVPYPAFSSKTVGGKPLFLYALEGMLDTIDIPKHDETIYRARLLKTECWSKKHLQNYIEKALSIVPRSKEESKRLGDDFRQDLIRSGWRALLSCIPEHNFTVLHLSVACSSGTYMRTLATRIATELGTSALALSINRVQMGRYRRIGPFSFWTGTF